MAVPIRPQPTVSDIGYLCVAPLRVNARHLHTGRYQVCRRAFPHRMDEMVIAHKADGNRCPGSGQESGEDLAIASWLPLSAGLTPHGLRHGHKTWMDETRSPTYSSPNG